MPLSWRQQRGFSLVEALLAIIIVASGVLALLGVISYAFTEVQVNATQVQAIALGQQYLDALRNAAQSQAPLPTATTAPIDQGDSFMNGATNTASSLFTISPNTCPLKTSGVNGAASQYDCLVAITWTQKGQKESITLETFVTK